jgi:IS30 family transposase
MPQRKTESLWWRLLQKARREILEQALADHGSSRAAAKALGINPSTFCTHLRKAGIQVEPSWASKAQAQELAAKTRKDVRRKAKDRSLSSWVKPPAAESSESFGNGSPPPEGSQGATPSWLIDAVKLK